MDDVGRTETLIGFCPVRPDIMQHGEPIPDAGLTMLHQEPVIDEDYVARFAAFARASRSAEAVLRTVVSNAANARLIQNRWFAHRSTSSNLPRLRGCMRLSKIHCSRKNLAGKSESCRSFSSH
jgi:hypothetical protein